MGITELFTDFKLSYAFKVGIVTRTMESAFIECPVCKGEGVDLDGYICWKCRGHGQIKYEDITRDWTNMNNSLHKEKP